MISIKVPNVITPETRADFIEFCTSKFLLVVMSPEDGASITEQDVFGIVNSATNIEDPYIDLDFELTVPHRLIEGSTYEVQKHGETIYVVQIERNETYVPGTLDKPPVDDEEVYVQDTMSNPPEEFEPG